MLSVLYERSYPADLPQVRTARDGLTTNLIALGLGDEVRHAFQAALSEVMVNLCRHARPAPERIAVQFGRDHDNWVLDIFDDGGAFEEAERQLELRGDTVILDENGMGIGIVARLFPDHSYTPAAEWQDVRNRFRLRSPFQDQDLRPKILIIDDDPVIRRIFSGVLKDEATILTAETAEEGQRLLLKQPVEMVICDIRMPEISGVEFRRALAQSNRFADLPFIFITGEVDSDLARQAEAMPIDDLLEKPVRADKLRQVVRRTLLRSRFLRRRARTRFDEQVTDLQHPRPAEATDGYATEVRWRVAEAGGGDVVAWLPHRDGRVMIIADLMGHGLDAKLEARALAAFLEGALAANPSLQPAEIIQILSDRILEAGVMNEMIATLQVALMRSDGSIRIAGAGHPPPLLSGPAGVEPLPVTGALPGLSPAVCYEEISVTLSPKERLLFFTDGLCERVSLDVAELLGRQQIIENPAAAADEMITAFDAAAPRPLRDDVTFVLIERR